jgi:Tfp pilus assembly protein PilF
LRTRVAGRHRSLTPDRRLPADGLSSVPTNDKGYLSLNRLRLVRSIQIIVLLALCAGPVLTLSSGNFSMVLLARALMGGGGSGAAKAALTQALSLGGSAGSGKAVSLGQLAEHTGDYAAAAAYLQQAVDSGVRPPISALYLGKAYEDGGQHAKAVAAWSKARLWSEATARGRAALIANDLAGAEAEFRLVLEQAPGAYPAYLGLGRVYQLKRQWADAARVFSQGLGYSPDDTELLVEYGDSLSRASGNAARAAVPVQKALQISPTCYWCYLKLVGLYERAGMLDSATGTLLSAESKAVGQTGLLFYSLARLEWAQGAGEPALNTIERGLRRFPSDATLYGLRGDIFQKLGRGPDACSAYKAAVKFQPGNAQFQTNVKRQCASSTGVTDNAENRLP